MTPLTLNLRHARLLKTGLLIVAGFFTQAALAACPVVYFTSDVVRLNTADDQDGKTIYFCKQDGFTNSQMQYNIQPNSLIDGGSQVIPMGQAIQKTPINGSINLIGPDVTPLNLKSVIANTRFPNGGGLNNKSALFNFYTRVDSSGTSDMCTGTRTRKDQYDIIRTYLRANPGIFQSNNRYPSSSGPKVATAITTGNDLAVIKNAEIRNGNSYLKADITFYHVNAGESGQFFTDRDVNRKQFCWVGVGTKIDIRDDSTNINQAGEYLLDVGISAP